MDAHLIERIKDATNLVDLISGRVRLKKTGKDYTGLCPFHDEKSPSFTVSPAKQFYHCFGCGANGDAIKWLTETEGLQFEDGPGNWPTWPGLQSLKNRTRGHHTIPCTLPTRLQAAFIARICGRLSGQMHCATS